MYAPVAATILPPPEKIENVYGANPPLAENVNKLFTAKVFVAGEIVNALTTVTVAFDVLLNESVTRTVTEPAVAGAVNAPVAATILPPPLTIEYVYGLTPPLLEKVCVPLMTKLTEAGEIASVELIVTVEFAVCPIASVTRTTALPAVAGAVYAPVAAIILPPPEKIENVYGARPPLPAKENTLLTAKVFVVGVMAKTETTVTVEFEIFESASVTRTVTEPAVTGAVNNPVVELILPPPLTIEKTYGLTPPLAENVCVALTAFVTEAGEIANAAFTVTVALAVALNESVTRTVTVPAVAGAVKKPVAELIVPPPEKIEYVNGPDPPTAEKVCVLLTANVTAAGEIPNAFVIVTVEFAV